MKQYGNVLDKPLNKGKTEVSLSAFAFLFSELVQYNQTQVDNIGELERRLEDAGYAVGARVLELLCHRDKYESRSLEAETSASMPAANITTVGI
ncbi:trafficking protein particle complex subunit 5-like protein [Trifolium pratense]|uniref:Trafficking protein particle complex subunit 5-like protein n=1 Tax=Trifolium pratense TaxID=57577 RepID=A0A2K3LHY2_TRIPR|nr:trafficking protein particle complex subunit 5-like protein [Trifolium pratense]